MKKEFAGQSYKWDRYTIEYPDECSKDIQDGVIKAIVEIRKDGNHTMIKIVPDVNAEPIAIMNTCFSGEIDAMDDKTKTILAITSSGSWSGGSNYSGMILGKLGSWVSFKKKSQKNYFKFINPEKGYESFTPEINPTIF